MERRSQGAGPGNVGGNAGGEGRQDWTRADAHQEGSVQICSVSEAVGAGCEEGPTVGSKTGDWKMAHGTRPDPTLRVGATGATGVGRNTGKGGVLLGGGVQVDLLEEFEISTLSTLLRVENRIE